MNSPLLVPGFAQGELSCDQVIINNVQVALPLRPWFVLKFPMIPEDAE